MSWILSRRKCQEREHKSKTALLRNGATLLEELITSCNGKRNPFRNFSAEELKIATNNYDPQLVIYDGGYYKLYKGLWQKRLRRISVMKFEPESRCISGRHSSFKNVVFPSQINHKNVLKLIGCCLETELPTIIFEYVESGTLANRIRGLQSQQLQWKHRLKIAMEISNAATYLHIGLPRPIVFGNITPSRILFDEQGNPKLFDFSFSEFIPEGETHIERQGFPWTPESMAPECFGIHKINERSDVFSFGALLLELLSGGKTFEFEWEETKHDVISDISDMDDIFSLTRLIDGRSEIMENDVISEITGTDDISSLRRQIDSRSKIMENDDISEILETNDISSLGRQIDGRSELMENDDISKISKTDDKWYNENNSLFPRVKRLLENNSIVDPVIVQEGVCLERRQQLHTFLELALKCTSKSPEARPDMIDTAKQLRQLYLSA